MPHKGTLLNPVAHRTLNDSMYADIMRKIGELFLLRTNINSVGSVLDSPVGHFSYTALMSHGHSL